jgi:hypothetical protein
VVDVLPPPAPDARPTLGATPPFDISFASRTFVGLAKLAGQELARLGVRRVGIVTSRSVLASEAFWSWLAEFDPTAADSPTRRLHARAPSCAVPVQRESGVLSVMSGSSNATRGPHNPAVSQRAEPARMLDWRLNRLRWANGAREV